jgi:hypothetical protein
MTVRAISAAVLLLTPLAAPAALAQQTPQAPTKIWPNQKEGDLSEIKARLMAINSADDEANPARLTSTAREIVRIPGTKYVLISASEETHGHFTHLCARFWKAYVADFLKELPAQL